MLCIKALSFIDESGVPTKRYYEFLDQSQSGRVLAEAVREAYSDLFAVNKNAQDMTVEEVKNKLRTLTLGQKSENVVSLMANTFKALTSLADWETPPAEPPAAVPSAEVPPRPQQSNHHCHLYPACLPTDYNSTTTFRSTCRNREILPCSTRSFRPCGSTFYNEEVS